MINIEINSLFWLKLLIEILIIFTHKLVGRKEEKLT